MIAHKYFFQFNAMSYLNSSIIFSLHLFLKNNSRIVIESHLDELKIFCLVNQN